MGDEIIEIEDYEVKEKSEVLDVVDEDNNHSEGFTNNNSSGRTYTRTYSASLNSNALMIIGLVAILLIAIFVLTIC